MSFCWHDSHSCVSADSFFFCPQTKACDRHRSRAHLGTFVLHFQQVQPHLQSFGLWIPLLLSTPTHHDILEDFSPNFLQGSPHQLLLSLHRRQQLALLRIQELDGFLQLFLCDSFARCVNHFNASARFDHCEPAVSPFAPTRSLQNDMRQFQGTMNEGTMYKQAKCLTPNTVTVCLLLPAGRKLPATIREVRPATELVTATICFL